MLLRGMFVLFKCLLIGGLAGRRILLVLLTSVYLYRRSSLTVTRPKERASLRLPFL